MNPFPTYIYELEDFKDCAQGGQFRRLAYNEFKQGQHLMGVL